MKNNQINLDETLDTMAEDLQSFLSENERTDFLIVGIHTGGVWIANQLRQRLQLDEPLGELNIAFYRDDFSRIGMHPTVEPSKLPFSIEDKHVVLVDDVLFTGRTIRAAMNELFDYGRPASICLAVLIERSGRELPVHADVVGKTITLKANEHVKLSGPEPLECKIMALEQ